MDYNDYFSVIRQENAMITIFVKIAEILQEEDVELNLSEVKFNR